MRYSSSRVACLCTQCSLDLWASSHLDTMGKQMLSWLGVSDCCFGLGPVQIGPFPTTELLIFTCPVCGPSWIFWILVPAAQSCLVSEGFASGVSLTCVHLLKVRRKSSTAIACYGAVSTYHDCNIFQPTTVSTELLGLSLLFPFNVLICSVLLELLSWADHWKLDTGILLHFCSVVFFSAWLINQCKHQEAGFSFTASSLLCISNAVAPFQPALSDDAKTVAWGCKDIALPALGHLDRVTEWELTLVPFFLTGAGLRSCFK